MRHPLVHWVSTIVTFVTSAVITAPCWSSQQSQQRLWKSSMDGVQLWSSLTVNLCLQFVVQCSRVIVNDWRKT